MIAIVSSIAVLHSFGPASAGPTAPSHCKIRGHIRKLIRIACAVLLGTLVAAGSARGEDDKKPETSAAVSAASFLGGAAAAFAAHEGGHLLFDAIFDAHPFVKKVEFGGIPFFAVSHEPVLTPRQEFTVSSAGFWVQHATDEWLLTTRPHLRDEHAPFVKGMLAFNVLTSVGYSMAAFAQAGPYERDTRGMASSSRIDEPVIGALILAPAALDAYRYYRPDSKWAKWAARVVKAGGVLLVLR